MLKFCINLYLTKLNLIFKEKIIDGRRSGRGGLDGQNSKKIAQNGQKLKLLLFALDMVEKTLKYILALFA